MNAGFTSDGAGGCECDAARGVFSTLRQEKQLKAGSQGGSCAALLACCYVAMCGEPVLGCVIASPSCHASLLWVQALHRTELPAASAIQQKVRLRQSTMQHSSWAPHGNTCLGSELAQSMWLVGHSGQGELFPGSVHMPLSKCARRAPTILQISSRTAIAAASAIRLMDTLCRQTAGQMTASVSILESTIASQSKEPCAHLAT